MLSFIGNSYGMKAIHDVQLVFLRSSKTQNIDNDYQRVKYLSLVFREFESEYDLSNENICL